LLCCVRHDPYRAGARGFERGWGAIPRPASVYAGHDTAW
jgi:hypothetical protein